MPGAKPKSVAVTGHAYASVTAPGGATSPMSWLQAAACGAIRMPAGRIRNAIAGIEGASSPGRKPSGSSAESQT